MREAWEEGHPEEGSGGMGSITSLYGTKKSLTFGNKMEKSKLTVVMTKPLI